MGGRCNRCRCTEDSGSGCDRYVFRARSLLKASLTSSKQKTILGMGNSLRRPRIVDSAFRLVYSAYLFGLLSKYVLHGAVVPASCARWDSLQLDTAEPNLYVCESWASIYRYLPSQFRQKPSHYSTFDCLLPCPDKFAAPFGSFPSPFHP